MTGGSSARPASPVYRALAWPARAWTGLLCVLAVTLPYLAWSVPTAGEAVFALVLVLLGGVNAEVGRWVEGGRVLRQRPHKALSAWPFAAAIVLPTTLLPLVVALTYGWTRARGIRVPLWKWVGSGAILVLAGLAAAAVATPSSPGRVLVAGVLFLLLESVGLAVCALVNDAQDEAWLRAQLRSRSFYGVETGILATGAAVGVLWSVSAGFVLLVLPLFVLLQRAVLVEPLRAEAATDDKTGLLHYDAWRLHAERATGSGAVAVLFADLDHFKAVNDTFGHLVGDRVLAEVASRLVAVLRGRDLPGRFGGEEFCVLLPAASAATAGRVADRLRDSVRDMRLDGVRITLSVGIGMAPAGTAVGLDALLAAADRAVYAAKAAGRDCTRVQLATVPSRAVPPQPRRARPRLPGRVG